MKRVGGFGHLKMGMVRTCYSYEIIVNLLFMTVLSKYTTGPLNGGFINPRPAGGGGGRNAPLYVS